MAKKAMKRSKRKSTSARKATTKRSAKKTSTARKAVAKKAGSRKTTAKRGSKKFGIVGGGGGRLRFERLTGRADFARWGGEALDLAGNEGTEND